jgi:hypothetical protein
MAGPTLVYFDFPVRAEVARLLFTLGKVEFEVSAGSKACLQTRCCAAQTSVCHWLHPLSAEHDVALCFLLMDDNSNDYLIMQDKRISYEEWPQIQNDWKPKCPFGQVPILMIDGKVLAQSAAIGGYNMLIIGCIEDA